MRRWLISHRFCEQRAAAGPPRSLRLSTILAQQPQLSEFTRKWQAIAPADVRGLIDVLAAEHIISPSTQTRLNADVTKISAACTTKARASAASRLLTDARHRSGGETRLLIEGAAKPFEHYHAKISQPLVRCASRRRPSTRTPTGHTASNNPRACLTRPAQVASAAYALLARTARASPAHL